MAERDAYPPGYEPYLDDFTGLPVEYLLPARGITLLITTPSLRTPEESHVHEAFLRNAHKPPAWQAHFFEAENLDAYLQTQ